MNLGCVLTFKKNSLVGFLHKGVNCGNSLIDLKVVHCVFIQTKVIMGVFGVILWRHESKDICKDNYQLLWGKMVM